MIGFRAAMRVLPYIVDESRRKDFQDETLSTFRSLITAYASAIDASVPATSGTKIYGSSYHPAAVAAYQAAYNAQSSASPKAGSEGPKRFCEAIVREASEIDKTAWPAFDHDASMIDKKLSVLSITNEPLWPRNMDPAWEDNDWWNNTGPVLPANEKWQNLKNFLLEDPDLEWSCWIDWWEAHRNGTSLHPIKAKRIALIPHHEWKNGPTYVNSIVSKIMQQDLYIEEGFILSKLKNKITEIEKILRATTLEKSRYGIGGNNPPEELEIGSDLIAQTTNVYITIGQLKEQTEETTPKKHIVLNIIEKLIDGLKSTLALIGRLGEHALKVSIQTAIPIGTIALIGNPGLLKDIIDLAKKWLDFLQ